MSCFNLHSNLNAQLLVSKSLSLSLSLSVVCVCARACVRSGASRKPQYNLRHMSASSLLLLDIENVGRYSNTYFSYNCYDYLQFAIYNSICVQSNNIFILMYAEIKNYDICVYFHICRQWYVCTCYWFYSKHNIIILSTDSVLMWASQLNPGLDRF